MAILVTHGPYVSRGMLAVQHQDLDYMEYHLALDYNLAFHVDYMEYSLALDFYVLFMLHYQHALHAVLDYQYALYVHVSVRNLACFGS